MRGRRPKGLASLHQLPGSSLAKERFQVIVENLVGLCRTYEACARLGVSEPRFQQLRERFETAGLEGLEPRAAGRPASTRSPEAERIRELEEQLAAKEVELRAALARAEIALTLPRVAAQETEPGKKTRGRPRKARPPGKRKRT
jgi:transposase